MAHVEKEVAKDLATARRVDDLRVELDTEDPLAVGEGSHRRVAAGRKELEAWRHLAHVVPVTHPHR